MKNKIVHFYKRLTLIQRLSIPLILASLAGFILTIVLVKQVQLIDENTLLMKDELIPALEKSNQNLALLQTLSEKFTFATLAAEEEMILEIEDHELIEQNLREIGENKYLKINTLDTSLTTFQDYFSLAKKSALAIIQSSSLSAGDITISQDLLTQHRELKENFEALKKSIEYEIEERTVLIGHLSDEVIYYTITFVLVFAFVLLVTSYMNYRDFNDYDVIQAQRKELISSNAKIQNSIDYAALMQKSILPEEHILNKYTKQCMVCWQPKDTVGGDIYFVAELESKKEVIIMVIDGVGHGVSGAFLTILVKAIETQIIANINKNRLEASPAKILQYFNRKIKEMLKQDATSPSNSGFDGSVLYYNSETLACKYAGAKSPLYIVHDGKVEIIKGDRSSVGFTRTKYNQEYTEYAFQVQKDAKYYMLTDGMIDQEGENHGRYGKKRFKEIILKNHDKFFLEQRGNMFRNFHQFKGDFEQSDDITVLGMQFI